MIPPVIHFIWIQGTKPFGYGEFLSIVSALQNTECNVILHTDMSFGLTAYCPSRIYHERFEIRQRDYRRTISGVTVTLVNICDIERYKIIQEEGGIYCDLDVIWFKHPIELLAPDSDLIATYENPTYKIVNSAIMSSSKGNPQITPYLENADSVIGSLAKKGITDISVWPKEGLPQGYLLLNRYSSSFLKSVPAKILPKKLFHRNGARSIARCLAKAGVTLKPSAVPLAQTPVKRKTEQLNLDDVTGFHFFNGLFDIEQLLELPVVREKMTPILDYATTFLV